MIIDRYYFDRICKATDVEYEPIGLSCSEEEVYLTESTVQAMLEDLLLEVEHLKEVCHSLENNLLNDYDPELEIPQIHGEGISW